MKRTNKDLSKATQNAITRAIDSIDDDLSPLSDTVPSLGKKDKNLEFTSDALLSTFLAVALELYEHLNSKNSQCFLGEDDAGNPGPLVVEESDLEGSDDEKGVIELPQTSTLASRTSLVPLSEAPSGSWLGKERLVVSNEVEGDGGPEGILVDTSLSASKKVNLQPMKSSGEEQVKAAALTEATKVDKPVGEKPTMRRFYGYMSSSHGRKASEGVEVDKPVASSSSRPAPPPLEFSGGVRRDQMIRERMDRLYALAQAEEQEREGQRKKRSKMGSRVKGRGLGVVRKIVRDPLLSPLCQGLSNLRRQILRSQLVSNLALAHLAWKLGLPTLHNASELLQRVSDHLSARLLEEKKAEVSQRFDRELRSSTAKLKPMGDVFEMYLGLLFHEEGFSLVHDWFRQMYQPLIRTAAKAFCDFHLVAKQSATTKHTRDEGSGTESSDDPSPLKKSRKAKPTPLKRRGDLPTLRNMALTPKVSRPVGASLRSRGGVDSWRDDNNDMDTHPPGARIATMGGSEDSSSDGSDSETSTSRDEETSSGSSEDASSRKARDIPSVTGKPWKENDEYLHQALLWRCETDILHQDS
ncbi:hypothetical protein JAAARDRAFT_201097 [Jaapia argillacea MUCL 33604]|uniref:RNase III domain-containing protein n=1 Tax=Jaapia argillacea MUCL 33604 TaxID=933084 RepID=A0A067P321_9AGAM|nr:hypothetical protein JAAARDRAFT_201097 [Jaapia argillacea MUCL 33604]